MRLSARTLVAGIAASKLLVHLYAGRHYGYFVDELYYLACSRHLDWGYVDQPPLIALATWLVRDVALGPLAFFSQETLAMLPVALPIWLAGLWFFFSETGRPFRALGWAWVFAAAVIVARRPRIYYLFPAFPLLFAAGSVVCESWRLRWLKPAWPAVMVAAGVALAPPAISGHQSYFLWGLRDYTGESVLVMQGRLSDLERLYSSVEKVARVYHPYSMPYQHFDVFYCRGLKQHLQKLWSQVKSWD